MFEKIGENFSIDHLINLDDLESLPEIIHEYGDNFDNVPNDKLCWMTYKRNSGSISFSRNTHKFYPEIAKYTIEYLGKIFDINFLPERVHFLRTIQSIEMHKDEAGRKSCINIGLRNSNSAKTYMSGGLPENFKYERKEFVVENGSAYLLDTHKWHSVQGTETKRYMITYGFGATFDQVKSKLINTHI